MSTNPESPDAFDTLRTALNVEPSPTFASRVAARVEADRHPRWRPWVFAMGLAAALVVFVVGAVSLGHRAPAERDATNTQSAPIASSTPSSSSPIGPSPVGSPAIGVSNRGDGGVVVPSTESPTTHAPASTTTAMGSRASTEAIVLFSDADLHAVERWRAAWKRIVDRGGVLPPLPPDVDTTIPLGTPDVVRFGSNGVADISPGAPAGQDTVR